MTELADPTLFKGLLDSLSTGAAKVSLQEKASGHSMDIYLWEVMQVYFERRYQKRPYWTKVMNTTPEELAMENTKNFFTALANESLYDAWRQSAVEKAAKLSVASQRAA